LYSPTSTKEKEPDEKKKRSETHRDSKTTRKEERKKRNILPKQGVLYTNMNLLKQNKASSLKSSKDFSLDTRDLHLYRCIFFHYSSFKVNRSKC
jgi:hypothetical protein